MLDSAVVFTLTPWHADMTSVVTTTRNAFRISFPLLRDAPFVAVLDV